MALGPDARKKRTHLIEAQVLAWEKVIDKAIASTYDDSGVVHIPAQRMPLGDDVFARLQEVYLFSGWARLEKPEGDLSVLVLHSPDPEYPEVCPRCKGRGVQKSDKTDTGTESCSLCWGRGTVPV